jgi:hypothetical protein
MTRKCVWYVVSGQRITGSILFELKALHEHYLELCFQMFAEEAVCVFSAG